MGPRWAQKGLRRNGPSSQDNSWSPLGPILGPSWAILRPAWAQLGPSKHILEPTWHPSCSLQALKTPTRPPNIPFRKLFLKPAYCPLVATRTAMTKIPKNQSTNPQAFGVGPAECAEQLNPPPPFTVSMGVLNSLSESCQIPSSS